MRYFTPLGRLAALLVVGAACLAGLGACESEGPNVGATLEDIREDPQAFYGQTVTVSGEVDEIYAPRTFTIGGEGFGGSLLVLSVDSVPVVPGRTLADPLVEDDIVQVTGTLEPLVAADIEQTYGVGLDEEAIAAFEQQPVLVARSTASVAQPILITPREGQGVAIGAAGEVITDAAAITGEEDPATLADRPATLEQVEVAEVLSDRIVWVEAGAGERLLVVLSPPAQAGGGLEVGQTLAVEGTLYEVPDETMLAAEWNLGPEHIDAVQQAEVYLLAARAVPASE